MFLLPAHGFPKAFFQGSLSSCLFGYILILPQIKLTSQLSGCVFCFWGGLGAHLTSKLANQRSSFLVAFVNISAIVFVFPLCPRWAGVWVFWGKAQLSNQKLQVSPQGCQGDKPCQPTARALLLDDLWTGRWPGPRQGQIVQKPKPCPGSVKTMPSCCCAPEWLSHHLAELLCNVWWLHHVCYYHILCYNLLEQQGIGMKWNDFASF